MRIIVTGASGFIGRQLVPRLKNMGSDLLIVGRDCNELRNLFPDYKVINYENLVSEGTGYDAIIHLAVANNNSSLERKIFNDVNINFLNRVAQDANAAKIRYFINLFSTHAQNINKNDHYSVSKRKGELALEAQGLPCVFNYYLPAVYGDSFSGKLSLLNYTPRFIRPAALKILGSLKPVLSIDKLADTIFANIEKQEHAKQSCTSGFHRLFLSDTQVGNRFFLLQKRFTDFSIALALLILLSCLFIIIPIFIKFSSRGPAIFAQRRCGKNGVKFTCFKFRTMSVDTPDLPTHLTPSAQLTKIGSFLRKTKLDELPQLFNILRNDMSLVGPRPCLPSQSELIRERRNRDVFTVKPGITGLAQVQGIDMSDPVTLATEDAKYVALSVVR